MAKFKSASSTLGLITDVLRAGLVHVARAGGRRSNQDDKSRGYTAAAWGGRVDGETGYLSRPSHHLL